MKRLLLIIPLFFLLQGCLLILFFAPKTDNKNLSKISRLEPYRKTYVRQCGLCHTLVAPSFYKENEEIDIIVKKYVKAKQITKEEAQDIKMFIHALIGEPLK